MAHAQQEAVRRRFGYRCGYCGVAEESVGGELTVDHYRPRARGGTDAEENLVYACVRCNLYKGDYWPDADADADGRRPLHPLLDRIGEHVYLSDSGRLEPLTPTGEFHIGLLHLNRPALCAHRARQQAVERQAARNAYLEHMVDLQRRAIDSLKEYVGHLESRRPPSDG